MGTPLQTNGMILSDLHANNMRTGGGQVTLCLELTSWWEGVEKMGHSFHRKQKDSSEYTVY